MSKILFPFLAIVILISHLQKYIVLENDYDINKEFSFANPLLLESNVEE